jgi:heptaprenyl diphosphate synthase
VKASKDNFFTRNTNPLHLFVTSALIIPAYLFQDELLIRIAQVLLFAGLSTVAGKKIKWMYFVVMVTSITFFNLLSPMGRVLLSIGPFAVTGGALENGVMKGFTIVGLVFISLFSIRPDLKLPGRIGGLLVRLFYYFERIVETKRQRLEPRRLVASIDDILDSLYRPGQRQNPPSGAVQATTTAGAAFMGVAVCGNWALLLV